MKKQPTTRDLQAMERRGQLLEAALELFSKQGYHATSVREINRKLGMADGLLYHYFPGGKLEMLQTIVHEAKDRRMEGFDAMTQLIDDNQSLKDVLLELFRYLLDMLERERDILRIQIREVELLEEGVNREIEDMFLIRFGRIEKLLEGRAAAGEIREMDYSYATKMVISIWIGVLFQNMSGINLIHQDVDDYLVHMIDHLLELWRP